MFLLFAADLFERQVMTDRSESFAHHFKCRACYSAAFVAEWSGTERSKANLIQAPT